MPDVGVGDFADEAAIFFIDGTSGSDVLPLEFFVVPDIFGVARLEVGVALNEHAVFDDATADAGGEG